MNDQQLCIKIVESLRDGVPPKRGINRYSVGNEKLLEGVTRYHLSGINDRGIIRFVSGSWGAGKTHFFRQLSEIAFKENLLVSNVELDVGNVALNKFERVFYAIISNIETPTSLETDTQPDSAPFGIVLREALGFIGGQNRHIPDEVPYPLYEKAVNVLMACNGIDIDFKKVIKKYWETFIPGEPDSAALQQVRGELLQWFSGVGPISSYRKRYEISKLVTKENAKPMLQSLAEFVRLAGYRGLLILFDEAEQSYSIMRRSALHDAHNNLLSLINNIESLNGLFLLYATTPDFYDDPKHGIVIYGALAGRVGRPEQRKPRALDKIWNLDNVEIELADYQVAALKIKDIYLTAYPEGASSLGTSEEVHQLVAELHKRHTQFSPVRFWRVMVAAVIKHFDDCTDGEVRPPETLYDDVMDRLRED